MFYSVTIILHFHQQCVKVPVAQHPCQDSVFSPTLILAILIDVQWYLDISICDSLMMVGCLPIGSAGKESACHEGDPGSIPG